MTYPAAPALKARSAKIASEELSVSVQTVNTAEEALAVLKVFRPVVILIDVQLPGMDGFELTRRLKADPQTRHVAILALTAYAMKADEERMLAAGCDGYIPKPIDTRQLTSQVAELLSRTSAGPGEQRQP